MMEFYCFKCQRDRDIQPDKIQKIITRKGTVRYRIAGHCPNDFSVVGKFAKKEDAERLKSNLDLPEKVIDKREEKGSSRSKRKTKKKVRKSKPKKAKAKSTKEKEPAQDEEGGGGGYADFDENESPPSPSPSQPPVKEKAFRFHGGHVKDIVVALGSVAVALFVTPYGLLGFLALITGMPKVDELIGDIRDAVRRKGKIEEIENYKREVESWVQEQNAEISRQMEEIEVQRDEVKKEREDLKDLKEKIGVDRVRKDYQYLLEKFSKDMREFLDIVNSLMDGQRDGEIIAELEEVKKSLEGMSAKVEEIPQNIHVQDNANGEVRGKEEGEKREEEEPEKAPVDEDKVKYAFAKRPSLEETYRILLEICDERNISWIGYRKLAQYVGISHSTAKEFLDILEELGLIRQEAQSTYKILHRVQVKSKKGSKKKKRVKA